MKNVLVVGDLILDEYIYVDPQKISDEAHVITSKIYDRKITLGGAGNVARNITCLGYKCTFIGLCSNEYKNIVLDQMKFYDINPKIFINENSLQVKTRIISKRGQQISRYDTTIEPKIDNSVYKQIIEYLSKNIKSFDFIVISKYYDFFIKEKLIKDILKIATMNDVKIIVDNRQNNINLFENVDFYKMNFNEFRNIFGDIENNFEAIKKIINKTNVCVKNILLTRSNLSTIVYNKEKGTFIEIDVNAELVNDVSGAGDTFVASFASNYQDNIEETIKYCHDMCNIVIKKLGTNVVWSYEDMSNNDIKTIVKHLNKNNKKIVLTNGVFDILHSGHIKLLKECKNCGDYLIVAINSDNSVKKIKGKDRPIKDENERKLILESLKFVDKVIIFDDLTVGNILKEIKPYIYIKGKDYNLSNIPEKEYLKYATKVKFIDLIENKSSTNIIKKIRS